MGVHPGRLEYCYSVIKKMEAYGTTRGIHDMGKCVLLCEGRGDNYRTLFTSR